MRTTTGADLPARLSVLFMFFSGFLQAILALNSISSLDLPNHFVALRQTIAQEYENTAHFEAPSNRKAPEA